MVRFGEDLPRRFGPAERLGVVIVPGDVALDRSLEIEHRVEAAALEPASGERREEGLDRIQPRTPRSA